MNRPTWHERGPRPTPDGPTVRLGHDGWWGLDHAEIDRRIAPYRSRGVEARRAIAGLQPKRAQVILAGACIVPAVTEKLNQPALTVSDRGLRHGVLIDRFGG